ncbi:MAG: hypothetical protein AMXMBFR81_14500 [Chthonomonas sp.]
MLEVVVGHGRVRHSLRKRTTLESLRIGQVLRPSGRKLVQEQVFPTDHPGWLAVENGIHRPGKDGFGWDAGDKGQQIRFGRADYPVG